MVESISLLEQLTDRIRQADDLQGVIDAVERIGRDKGLSEDGTVYITKRKIKEMLEAAFEAGMRAKDGKRRLESWDDDSNWPQPTLVQVPK